ncbi:MAG TPA: YegS/Rv2252/BmrU family lipid kinase [Gemmatimonadales bacterium]
MRHAHIILNPAAGRGAARRAKDPVARAFRDQGWTAELLETRAPGEGAALARAAVAAGATHVVAVGGDGIVHEVANGLIAAQAAAALGVVPLGSGNDFAKLVGTYRHGVARAVARLVTGRVQRFDAGRVDGGEYFVNTMGFGFGPAVVERRNASAHLKGFLSYFVPIISTFARFRPPRFEIASAEFRETGYVMLVEVCNGTTAGGSYRFAPDASAADGRLDVCVVRRVALPGFLWLLPRVMRGTHGSSRRAALFQTREVTVRSFDAPLLMHLDGELRGGDARECTVRIVKSCLNVLVAA